MKCLGFKGGTGTASRKISLAWGKLYPWRLSSIKLRLQKKLTIAGVPVGVALKDTLNSEFYGVPQSRNEEGDGSIIVIVATDAPLLPHQLKRIAQRVPIGIGVVGGREAMVQAIFSFPFQQQI